MNKLHLPDNIKVHFASCEEHSYYNNLRVLGVNYVLFSAFPFVFKKVFGKNNRCSQKEIERITALNEMRHTIQDSGLFSLLFGAKQHLANRGNVYKWFDGLVDFTLEHGCPFTCVEVDCQDILGSSETWDLRMKIRDALPNNRIINVFHLSDGKYGLDKLIEYSDYIAIGAPEFKKANIFRYIPDFANYIKRRKPQIDIHLLGCTDPIMLKKCNFCTSADSITWTSPIRFGEIDDYHIDDLDGRKIKSYFGDDIYNKIGSGTKEYRANAFCVSIERHKRLYQKNVGNQDFTINFK